MRKRKEKFLIEAKKRREAREAARPEQARQDLGGTWTEDAISTAMQNSAVRIAVEQALEFAADAAGMTSAEAHAAGKAAAEIRKALEEDALRRLWETAELLTKTAKEIEARPSAIFRGAWV